LAFLAPKIVEAIAELGALFDLKLTPRVDLTLDWTAQQRVFGLEQRSQIAPSPTATTCSRLVESIAKPNQAIPRRRGKVALAGMTRGYVSLWSG